MMLLSVGSSCQVSSDSGAVFWEQERFEGAPFFPLEIPIAYSRFRRYVSLPVPELQVNV